MKYFRKTVASLLTLALMAGLFLLPAYAAQGSEDSGDRVVYTCLGDSIAAGYSRPEYVARVEAGLVRVNGSYGALIADDLGVDQYNAYGTSGVRTQEMLMFLKDEYYGDAVTNFNMHYWVDTGDIENGMTRMRAQIRRGIRESSLITLGVGVNDLWLTLEGILLQFGTGKPYTGVEAAQAEAAESIQRNGYSGTMELVQNAAEAAFGVSTLVPQLAAAAVDAILSFESRYEEILQLIRKLNSDAVIVEVGYYNPFDVLTPGFPGIIDTYFGQMNQFLRSMEEKYEGVFYADVTGTETIFGTTFANDPHPTQAGHRYMADQILKVLEGKKLPAAPEIPAEPEEPASEPEPAEDTVCAAFTDINRNSWYHEAVHYAIENGIMGGTGNGKFEPGIAVTRAMIAQMIYAMEGHPAVPGRASFDDVAAGMWYTDAVGFVYRNKIMGGYSERSFGPEDYVTREQLATLLRGYAEYKGRSTSEEADIADYSDVSAVSPWALRSVKWAVGTGIIAGRNGNKLAPAERATRAEVAQMIMKFREN